ncbi:hypothetical protein HDF26_001736 [Pedobacter cryoconitis]|uniref:DUF4397 domain-containing protein n=1 Tax=Pedobacter cryoconitis TaxID=188932 RepID=A0A7W9DZC4_9SPHI|nr:hypothetical protein [Pedobacter cryoconitis]MBB5636908.1 hypothetical protein [Pedobacter cryoconitis]MBB6271309.1 hypothetical protein [Pedobacter cryoconitis]
MKKYISIALTSLLALTLFSCTKKADIAGIEPKLPNLQLSSLGYQQSSPFSLTNTLQLNFGATAKVPVGKFVIEVLDGNAVISTVTFPAWSGYDLTYVPATGTTAAVINHSISYVLQDTNYPNTQVYSGAIILKLSKLNLVAGKVYGIRATAYAATGTLTSVLTQASFFKIAL